MKRFPGLRLWVGSARDARDFRSLFDQSIQAVIDLALEELPAQLPRELLYCHLPLVDGPGNPPWLLRAAVQFTGSLITSQTNVLIACGMGMSRSPCIGAAALAYANGGKAEDYLTNLLATGVADMAPGLWKEVLETLEALCKEKSYSKTAPSEAP
jgi:protein-tyrosine phosphatase